MQNYQAFRLDQDTGSAIQAPGRCDLYMGVGAEAENRAGHQLYEGFLYYLAKCYNEKLNFHSRPEDAVRKRFFVRIFPIGRKQW